MIDGIKIFDAHMHYLGRFKKREEPLTVFLDKYGIDKAIITSLNQAASLSALMSNDENVDEKTFLNQFVMKQQYNHEEVRKLIQAHPERLVGFFWFNPRIASNDDWRLLERYIKEYRFKGVKTQCFVDLLKVPDDLYSLSEFCIDRNVPLFLHSGVPFFYQGAFSAKDYYELAKKYKDLKVIIGHAAFSMEYCINCIRYFRTLPNVYFETSTSIPYGIMTLIKTMGSNRVMYGSDAPTANPPDIEINKIKVLNLDKQTLEDVFYNTVSKLIGEKD